MTNPNPVPVDIQLIDIGTMPGDGSGDPLRVSFDKINQNFDVIFAELANLEANGGNVSSVTAPVTSVAGKVGNVVLYANDIQGAISQTYIQNQLQALVQDQVDTAFNQIVGAAPGTLNTLEALSEAIANDPTFALDIVEQLRHKISDTGGTMIGPLLLHADPINDLQAATKQYVDISEASGQHALDSRFNDLVTLLGLKETVLNVAYQDSLLQTQINTKANSSTVTSLSGTVSTLSNTVSTLSGTVSSLSTTVVGKANASAVYTKAEVDALLLNITSTSGGSDDWGLITQPVTLVDDYGSI